MTKQLVVLVCTFVFFALSIALSCFYKKGDIFHFYNLTNWRYFHWETKIDIQKLPVKETRAHPLK